MVRKVDRYAGMEDGGHSEYGGGETPQRFPDGSSRDLVNGVVGSASERARLMRTAGIHDYDPDPALDVTIGELTALEASRMSAAQRIAYEKDLVLSQERRRRRAELEVRTNDYIDEPEQYVGEPVSPESVRSSSLGRDLKSGIEGDHA